MNSVKKKWDNALKNNLACCLIKVINYDDDDDIDYDNSLNFSAFFKMVCICSTSIRKIR